MPKADTNSTRFAPAKSLSDRRSFMALATSAAIVATAQRANAQPAVTLASKPSFAAPAGADPILAAIEAHKTANAALNSCFSRKNELEEHLMDAVAGIEDSMERYGQLKAMQAASPEWVASEQQIDELHYAEQEATIGLIDVKPTTLVGAAALLRHIMQYEADFALPEALEDEHGELRSWTSYLCENLADLLSQAA